jgi:hypothetical protein
MKHDLMSKTRSTRDLLFGIVFALIAHRLATAALRHSHLLVLLWPAVSFALVSAAYLIGEVRVFGKRRDGSRNPLATVMLLPYLMFARGVWLLQLSLSSAPATAQVNRSLVIARRMRAHELPADAALVCDLTCEFLDPKPIRSRPGYVTFPILDASIAPAEELIAMAQSLPPPAEGALVLFVHCAKGHGRTGMFAATWLMVHGFAKTADAAVAQLVAARPELKLRRKQRAVLDDVQTMLANERSFNEESEETQ